MPFIFHHGTNTTSKFKSNKLNVITSNSNEFLIEEVKNLKLLLNKYQEHETIVRTTMERLVADTMNVTIDESKNTYKDDGEVFPEEEYHAYFLDKKNNPISPRKTDSSPASPKSAYDSEEHDDDIDFLINS